MNTRSATIDDAAAIMRIYHQGMEDRLGTFETSKPDIAAISNWFDGGPIVVTEAGQKVVGFAASYPYRSRPALSGILEFRVYVERSLRGRGAGRAALLELCSYATSEGYWKLVSRVFPENAAARKMLAGCGFREIGVYENHAKLDDIWRDVVIVERLLGDAALSGARRHR